MIRSKEESIQPAYLVVNDASAYVITLSMREGESRDKWLPELTRVAQTFQIE